MPSLAYGLLANVVKESLSSAPKEMIPCDLLDDPQNLKAFETSCIEVLTKMRDYEDNCHEIWWAAQALKKYSAPCKGGISARERREDAIAGFLRRNVEAASHSIPYLGEQVKRLIALCLPEVTLDSVEAGRFGPGAVAEGLDSWQRWETAACISESWLRQPSPWQSYHGLLPPLGDAKLCAVPKSAWKDRLITVEPMLSSYGQQTTRLMMLESIHKGILRGTPTDFLQHPSGRNVSQQQERCIKASFLGTLATVDLSDASDSISMEQVEWLFPEWLWPWLRAFRSDYVLTEGKRVLLNIYAGMGNATTFLVESVFFFAVFTAISRVLAANPADVTVFGDDVIMDSRVVNHPHFEEMVCRWGLKLNKLKTFSAPDCHFREACGCAALAGRRIADAIRMNDPGERQRPIAAAGLVTRLSASPYAFHHVCAWHFLAEWPDVPVVNGTSEEDSSIAFTWLIDERGVSRKRFARSWQRWEVFGQVIRPSYAFHRVNHEVQERAVLLASLAKQVDLCHDARKIAEWRRFDKTKSIVRISLPNRPLIRHGWVAYDPM